MPKTTRKSISPAKPSGKTATVTKKAANNKKSAAKSASKVLNKKTAPAQGANKTKPSELPKLGPTAKPKSPTATKSLANPVKPLKKALSNPPAAPSKTKGKVASKSPISKPTATKAGLGSLTSSTQASAKGKLKQPPIASAKPASKIVEKLAEKKAPPKPSAKKQLEIAPPPSNTKPEIVAKIRQAQAEKELRKDLAQPAAKSSLTPLTATPPIVRGKDRLVLMVRDPYWLHAHWDITRQTVERAKVSLAENWHMVKPILRLLKMDDTGTTSNAETVFRDIEIHGGVRNWYVEVDSPPSRFRMLMGYLSANDRFYELARSNTVVTPVPGGKEATDDHWADIATDAEHIYSMSGGYGDDTQTGDLTEVFEERLKRTMDADVLSQFGSGAEGSLKRHKHFHFDVDAELIVFGSTHSEAHVTVGSEPVKVRSDGSFSIRMPLPDRRQVLPATAKSRDGVDEQTVVIAVERNTKVMEPLSLDSDDL
jgi:hypothetical protein